MNHSSATTSAIDTGIEAFIFTGNIVITCLLNEFLVACIDKGFFNVVKRTKFQ